MLSARKCGVLSSRRVKYHIITLELAFGFGLFLELGLRTFVGEENSRVIIYDVFKKSRFPVIFHGNENADEVSSEFGNSPAAIER